MKNCRILILLLLLCLAFTLLTSCLGEIEGYVKDLTGQTADEPSAPSEPEEPKEPEKTEDPVEPEEPEEPVVCEHDFGTWIAPTYTCTASGSVGHFECQKCHKCFDENHEELTSIKVYAKGHKGGVATCTEPGVCTVCKAEYIAPRGHSFAVTDLSQIGTDGKATLTCKNDSSHVECLDVITFSMKAEESYCLTVDAVNDFIEQAQDYDEYDFTYTYVTAAAQNPQAQYVTVGFSSVYNKAVSLSVSPKEICLEISKNADMSDALLYHPKATASSFSVENLETGATYYARASLVLSSTVKVTTPITSFVTEQGVRPLHLSKVANARDIGGWETVDGSVVKEGLVIRSGRLDSISAEAKDFLLNVIGVKTELDLRSEQNLIDVDGNADRTESFLGSTVNYIRVSGTQGSAFFSSPNAASEAMLVFADPANYPIIVHCSAGADRTGALCMALEGLIGVSENNTVADYELTYQRFRNPDNPDLPESYCTCQMFLQTLHGLEGETFGEKLRKFFDETCKLTEMELSNIRNILTTDSAVFLSDSLDPLRAERNVFHLDMRSSGGIQSVMIGGADADYTFDEETSTLTVTESLSKGKHIGLITFADGCTLSFEIQAK